jgi:hypothetical protein
VGLPSIFCPGTQLLRSWLMNFQFAAEDHRASPQSASTPLAPYSYDPFSFSAILSAARNLSSVRRIAASIFCQGW